MNTRLAQRIHETRVKPGRLAIFWIAQAGFVYKTPAGKVIYIDPYLTDSVHRQLADVMYGFKRLTMTPIEPEEVEADCIVCTHSHPDHLDVDLIPILARKHGTRFVGAPDCRAGFEQCGVPGDRYAILQRGETLDYGDFRLTGVYADHGELAPDALGVILQVGDVKVWQVGDSAYRPDMWQDVFAMGVDVLIPPINGAFGNLDGVEAAKLAADCGAKAVIPCHFWMFAEHNGDPARFLEACNVHAPKARPLLMTQGELFVYEER
jgi:L-ascorbate 6-phosphate lactonase